MNRLLALGLLCGAVTLWSGCGPRVDGCRDLVFDGNETDLDCGGSCAPCPLGDMCIYDRDCASNYCTASRICSNAPVGVVANPYESCDPTLDTCAQQLDCLATTLPASAGYTGYLCTVTCATDADCPQDLNNYAAVCVNEQCYTSCPDGGAACPYGTQCLAFTDDTGAEVDLCSP